VSDETIEFDKTPLVEQQIEPLPGGEFALLMLRRNALGPTALLGGGLARVELGKEVFGGSHGGI